MKTKIKKYVRNPNVIFKEIDGIVYILDHETSTIHTLNQTASFIWKCMKTPLIVEDIVKKICEDYEVDNNEALKDVSKFVREYLKRKLVKTV